MGHGDIANDLLDLEARRRRGEPINEFQSARIHAEFRLARIIDSLNSGMPRSEVIGILAITSQTSRRVACDALGKVLRKAKFDQPQEPSPAAAKVKIQAEVSVGEAPPVTPKSDSSQAPAPIVHPAIHAKADPVVSVAQEMSPAPTDFKISAFVECVEKPAESSEEKKPDKWAHLSTDDVVGRGFLGEEHRWMTPEEIQKAKEDLERLHRISNEMSDRRKEIEKTKIQQKEATQTQPETQPDKE